MLEIKTLEEARAAAWRGAYRGLRSQGWKPSVYSNSCVMRGDHGHGRACAVGWLFSGGVEMNAYNNVQSLMKYKFEHLSPPLRTWYRSASSSQKKGFTDFLLRLQNLHDIGPADGMQKRFDRLGKAHGWGPPS